MSLSGPKVVGVGSKSDSSSGSPRERRRIGTFAFAFTHAHPLSPSAAESRYKIAEKFRQGCWKSCGKIYDDSYEVAGRVDFGYVKKSTFPLAA